MFFRSAVDAWFYVAVLSFPLLLARLSVPVLIGQNSTVIALGLAVILPLIILPSWVLFSTYYRIDSAILRINAGPYTCAVPLEQIHTVMPVRSLGLSPTLSRIRLRITYGRSQTIDVSPQRQAAFLEALGYSPSAVLQTSKQRPNPFALGENY
ncbi:MAG: PH domain-containing protein [Cyanobacteria bacterium J06560_2]